MTVEIDPDEGFARFTVRARNVVAAAHDAARSAGHLEIVPTHLVLGLLTEPDAVAAKAIEGCGVALDTVAACADGALPEPAAEAPELVPYGAEARKALELTFREALRLGHNYIGTEHLLLALLELEDGTGVLTDAGLDKPAVESWVVSLLAGRSERDRVGRRDRPRNSCE